MTRRYSNCLLCIAVCVVVCTSSVASADVIRLLSLNDFQRLVDTIWEVSPEQVRSWPTWDYSKEPPLPVSAAIEKAFQALPPDEKRADWELESIEIRQPVAVETRRAYGRILFYYVSLNRKSDSWSTKEFVVAFNGEVIQPRKESASDRKEGNAINIFK